MSNSTGPLASQPGTPSRIFVDGNCIVCDLEIAHYKRIAPKEFEIVDISDSGFQAGKFGLTAEAVNKHMHVQTPSGEILKGVDAFAHIWTRIAKYKKFSRLIKLPVIHQAAQVGYEVFAAVRPWLPKRKR